MQKEKGIKQRGTNKKYIMRSRSKSPVDEYFRKISKQQISSEETGRCSFIRII